MLAGLATWVIVGHSERRRDAGETDALIAAKLRRAMEWRLRPILCVGEQLADREAGRQDALVGGQVRGALAEIVAAGTTLDALVIAYEPVWAIGTGRNARGADAAAMAAVIRGSARRPWRPERRRIDPHPVRRQRHRGEHRGVPGRTVHRRRARRRGVAQAGRDGRHGRTSRPDGGGQGAATNAAG